MGDCKTKALLITCISDNQNKQQGQNEPISTRSKNRTNQGRENGQPLPSAEKHATVVERKKPGESRAAITFVSTSDWFKKLHIYSNLLAHVAQI